MKFHTALISNRLALVLLLTLVLSACGQKGNLYLPGEQQASAVTAGQN